jgi:hypothetical protein
MNKKLLNLSRLFSAVLLISTFLLISACIKIVSPTAASSTIPNNYTLTIQTAGQGSESASPVQTTYAPGTVAYLTATPATGWTFSDWSGSDDIANTTANSTTITINGNESVIATFIQNNYILNTSVIGNGLISLNNNGPYHYGDTVQLTATPAAGWIFANWSGDAVSSITATTVITINSDTNVIANFVEIRYSLSTSVSPSGGGSVSPSNGSYAYGSSVTLTATPATGYQFSSWSGDISGSSSSISISMNSNTNIVANFSAINYTLSISVSPSGSGSVTSISPSSSASGGSYVYGSTVQLTATPTSGYQFSSWSGDISSSSPTVNVTMYSNKNVIANFSAIHYTLSTSVSPSGGGSVSPGSGSYAYGSVVTLTATPSTGYQFSSWSGDISSSSSSISISMNSNTNVIANFVAIHYTLSTSVSPSGGGSVSPSSGSYAYGSVVTLTATPASGYQFSSWSGDISSSSQTVNVTLYSNKNVIATFTPIIYTPEPINYNMPGNGILGFSVWWTNYLNAGTEIKGTVSLSGSTPGGIDWSSNWIFEIDDPLGNVAFSQSYTFSSGSIKTFDFTTTQTGTWKIKVSDASNYQRNLQITILPAGW